MASKGRIRYPQPSYPAISYPAQGGGDTDGVTPDPYRSYAEGEDPTRWENFDVAGLWDQTAPARRADPAQARRLWAQGSACNAGSAVGERTRTLVWRAQGNDVLDEPGELFAQLTSQDFRRRQQQFWQSVRSSYQVLHPRHRCSICGCVYIQLASDTHVVRRYTGARHGLPPDRSSFWRFRSRTQMARQCTLCALG